MNAKMCGVQGVYIVVAFPNLVLNTAVRSPSHTSFAQPACPHTPHLVQPLLTYLRSINRMLEDQTLGLLSCLVVDELHMVGWWADVVARGLLFSCSEAQ